MTCRTCSSRWPSVLKAQGLERLFVIFKTKMSTVLATSVVVLCGDVCQHLYRSAGD